MVENQLIKDDYQIVSGSMRDKNNSVFSINKNGDFSFITLIEPLCADKNGIGRPLSNQQSGGKWLIEEKSTEISTDATVILRKLNTTVLVNCTIVNFGDTSLEIDLPATLIIKTEDEGGEILYLGRKKANLIKFDKYKVTGKTDDGLSPGERIGFN